MITVLVGVVALLLGVVIGRRFSYDRGVRHGQLLTELAHGYLPTLVPGIHRRRRWQVLNRQAPEPPGLVERHISPTNERRPSPRPR